MVSFSSFFNVSFQHSGRARTLQPATLRAQTLQAAVRQKRQSQAFVIATLAYPVKGLHNYGEWERRCAEKGLSSSIRSRNIVRENGTIHRHM